ncbi:winged helix-turn-helix domain-containing protein [Streptomyces sp. NPDC090741]|uniref:helix-turn-helix domain-containing protein n=1 Tax=Streptomyces sp. NPDC090741 TaxID=3365967 RepID=UPI003822EC2D
MPTSTQPGATPQQQTLPRVPAANQWITATKSRIATDRYSWMQAVHWANIRAGYTDNSSHGPQRISDTTLRVAQVLAKLNPCRPGIDFLARVLSLSERTVQYHLALLRGVGLLTYRTKGTRVPGVGGQASEFVHTIPPGFDDDLQLRTGPSEQYIRTVRGIDPAGLPLMKRLARLAGRAGRRPAKRTRLGRSGANPSCTPMGVGPSTSSPTGTSTLPPENKLASGKPNSPARKKPSTPKPKRSLNAVGRRFQLARELITQVPWLGRANTARIAWIVREVADAGWTTTEVIAVLSLENPAHRVHRPSGFLAARLHGATALYNTPERRAAIVAWWQDSRHAAQARHAEWDGTWQGPTSRAVAREVNAAIAQLHTTPQTASTPAYEVGEDGFVALEQLTRDEIIDLRAAAQKDPLLIKTTLATCGETYARRLFTNHLVDQVQRLAGVGRMVLHTQWGHA